MRPIAEIAEVLGLDPKVIIPYGHYKAKIPLEAIRDGGRRGKLVVVTGMTPTRAGRGQDHDQRRSDSGSWQTGETGGCHIT